MATLNGELAPLRTWLATAALMILVAVGAVGHTAGALVHDQLLQPPVYERALRDTDAASRVYSEVLADPEVRAATDRLLGNLTIAGRPDTGSLTIAVARSALPPARLHDLAAQAIRDVLAYVRGDTPMLSADVSLSLVVARLDQTVDDQLRQMLARTATRVLDDLASYEAAVRAFADDLAAGVVPAAIPVVGGRTVTDEQIVGVIEAAGQLGLPETVRDRVIAAVHDGDDRDALVAAASVFVQRHLERLLADLLHDGGGRIDLVDAIGEAAGQPQRRAVAELNSMRGAVRYLPPWTAAVSTVLLGGGVVGIGWIHRRRPLRASGVIGAALVLAGGLTAFVLQVVSRAFGSPLAALAGTRGRSVLPAAVRDLLADLDASVRATLRAGVTRDVRALVVAGSVLALVAAAPAIVSALRRARPRVFEAALAASFVLMLLGLSWRAPAEPADAARLCNGAAALCDRPYDQVVFPATHNSMSSSDVVRVWPQHDGGLQAQLEAGIRALLVDTKYWRPADGGDLASLDAALPVDVSALLRTVIGAGPAASDGTYLCHSRCDYGAVPLLDALTDVRAFLDAHPDEVVTLIIQNGITADDTEAAFEAAGLGGYLYDRSPGDGWPTLGELIDRSQRLVVIAERDRGPDWYHDGRELLTDTSFDVGAIDGFSCELGRGRPDAPLLLLNHWISREVPDRADAVAVNQPDVIVDRARGCEAMLGRLPTFVAVDFYGLGDVVGAAAMLNGVQR